MNKSIEGDVLLIDNIIQYNIGTLFSDIKITIEKIDCS